MVLVMNKSINSDVLNDFLDAFEEEFHRDLAYTKEMLGIPIESEEQKMAAQVMGLESIPVISEDGTFLEPLVEDETENWGHRGRLLAAYRTLKQTFA
jgi:hypothetical protein